MTWAFLLGVAGISLGIIALIIWIGRNIDGQGDL